MWKMQITCKLFEIAKGLAKTSQQTSRLYPIQTTSACKIVQLLMCCYLKNLLTLEWIDIIRLLAFGWINIIQSLPEDHFSFHAMSAFSFDIKVITLKFNQ